MNAVKETPKIEQTEQTAASLPPPNEQLAERIVLAMQNAGLVPERYASVIGKKLATGSAKELDWKLWAEAIITAKEATDEQQDKD